MSQRHPLPKRSMKKGRTPMSCYPCRYETLPLNHTTPITQAAHLKDPFTQQPHLTTQVEAWSSSHLLMSPSNASSRQTSSRKVTTLGTASTAPRIGTGTPGVPVPMLDANLLGNAWSRWATSTSLELVSLH